MKSTIIGLGLIVLLAIAVASAGCSGTSQPAAAPSAPSGGSATPAPAGTQQSAGSVSSSGSVGGDQLFGGLSYNWVEYKMSAGAGANAMTVYYKYNKQTGKCTMRFETAQKVEGMPTEMDCSSTGTSGKTTSDPNEANPDVKFVKVGTEIVTVPAGTFTADKYTATYQGTTSTYWMVNGKPLIKMAGGDATGSVTMELNGMG